MKFKVGDIVRYKKYGTLYKIKSILPESGYYKYETTERVMFGYKLIGNEDVCELV